MALAGFKIRARLHAIPTDIGWDRGATGVIWVDLPVMLACLVVILGRSVLMLEWL